MPYLIPDRASHMATKPGFSLLYLFALPCRAYTSVNWRISISFSFFSTMNGWEERL